MSTGTWGALALLCWAPASALAADGGHYRYFAPYPAPPTVQWFSKVADAEPPPVTRVHYAWATWCEPCRAAKTTLRRLVAEHPGKLRVLALSGEPSGVVRGFLASEPDMRAFDVGAVRYAEGGDPHEPPYLPFAVIEHRGEVVWRGNPIYPEGPVGWLSPVRLIASRSAQQILPKPCPFSGVIRAGRARPSFV